MTGPLPTVGSVWRAKDRRPEDRRVVVIDTSGAVSTDGRPVVNASVAVQRIRPDGGLGRQWSVRLPLHNRYVPTTEHYDLRDR